MTIKSSSKRTISKSALAWGAAGKALHMLELRAAKLILITCTKKAKTDLTAL
jgi:hypothetical protein